MNIVVERRKSHDASETVRVLGVLLMIYFVYLILTGTIPFIQQRTRVPQH